MTISYKNKQFNTNIPTFMTNNFKQKNRISWSLPAQFPNKKKNTQMLKLDILARPLFPSKCSTY